MAYKDTRNIKVIPQNGHNYKSTPIIMLKRQWLKADGFEIVDPVRVECEAGKLVVILDRERAKVVREIFDMRLAGMGLMDIAQNLNDRGIGCPTVYKH